jgi:hypothetical protein
MSQRFTPASSNKPILVLIVFLVLAGALSAAAAAEELLSRSPERGGVGLGLQRELQLREDLKSPRPASRRLLKDLNELDERLSIIVTDKKSTSAITFSEVMEKLASDVHVDKRTLFRRWWDTANIAPGLSGYPTNIFCDSQSKKVSLKLSEKNGFPYECPRAEGQQANVDPFENDASEAGVDDCDKRVDAGSSLPQRLPQNENGYTAIAFSNRFDLADKDRGLHCGEYRIVFAKNSGFTKSDNRNLIIFEALVPNPNPPESPVVPTAGKIYINLSGCRPIVEFWRSLSNPRMSTVCRGKALRDFFLKGLPDAKIGPVVDTRHYAGGPGSGQIRTNQFMENAWTLREFKTYGGSIVPATVKSNPGNDLFMSEDPQEEDPRKVELAAYLVRKDTLDNLRGLGVQKGLAGERNIDSFAFGLTAPGLDYLNSFESNERTGDLGDVVEAFNNCRLNTRCSDVIGDNVNGALAEAKSSLNTNNIIHRIRTQTCAGCHHYSNRDAELGVACPKGWPPEYSREYCSGDDAIWPTTLGGSKNSPGFTHVAENECEDGKYTELSEPPQDFVNLVSVQPERISRLSYMGPDGECSRYKISDTLKLDL